MTEGRFIAVVGPSGVGKDTVMAALAEGCARLVMARRVITRPSDMGGEDFDGVSVARFAVLRGQQRFLLDWDAHGLSYAIPVEVRSELVAGRDVLANISRRVVGHAQARIGRVLVLSLVARRDVLRTRLMARAREASHDIEARLARAPVPLPPGTDSIEIDNSGALETTVAAARAALYPVRA